MENEQSRISTYRVQCQAARMEYSKLQKISEAAIGQWETAMFVPFLRRDILVFPLADCTPTNPVSVSPTS